MPPAEALAAVAAPSPVAALSGIAFRSIHARYAATARSSIGSLRWGARYNAPGAFEALLLADSPVTAPREVEALIHPIGMLGSMAWDYPF